MLCPEMHFYAECRYADPIKLSVIILVVVMLYVVAISLEQYTQ